MLSRKRLCKNNMLLNTVVWRLSNVAMHEDHVKKNIEQVHYWKSQYTVWYNLFEFTNYTFEVLVFIKMLSADRRLTERSKSLHSEFKITHEVKRSLMVFMYSVYFQALESTLGQRCSMNNSDKCNNADYTETISMTSSYRWDCWRTETDGYVIQIKYGLPYCVTCPSMSTDPGSLNPGTRRSRVPGWWDPGIRTNTGAGDTVLAKHT